MEKIFSKYDLLYSIKSVYLRCSPGRSSPRYQMLVMNPGFFMPYILVTKIIDRFGLWVSFFRNFQIFDVVTEKFADILVERKRVIIPLNSRELSIFVKI